MTTAPKAHFGGPDRPRALRDLLQARVEAVPAGGEILFVAYYFRDRPLAEALLRAHRRGVTVKVVLEGLPRLRGANDRVVAMLAELGAGVRVLTQLGGVAHLHEKLYVFSHPRPTAFVGSFNPSGDPPDDPEVIRAIRDQDYGHNLLVELAGPEVEGLAAHARWLHAAPHGALDRISPTLNRPVQGEDLTAWFFPRLGNPLDRLLSELPAEARLRITASHLRDESLVVRLLRLARRGVRVELLTEATNRRVPSHVEALLRGRDLPFRRYRHPDGLPMHSKILLAETPAGGWTAFGSYNLTRTSRWLNNEILVVSRDNSLREALGRRWDELMAEPEPVT
jgi:phosphatidylserine/phosphatidylglycerophosphate/cardiolipin synthase-like enzyme